MAVVAKEWAAGWGEAWDEAGDRAEAAAEPDRVGDAAMAVEQSREPK